MSQRVNRISEMSFLDHLEELRHVILKSVLAIVIGMLGCFFFSDAILKFIISPTRIQNLNIELMFQKPAGMFMAKVNLSLACGFGLAMPVILYQLWRFISPGLLENEKKYIPWVIVFSTLMFLMGAAFAFFFLIPAMIQFFVLIGVEGVKPLWDIGEYMGLVIKMVLTMGLVFEMPLLIAFLTWIRILSAAFLLRSWRMSIVLIFILAAVITPTGDPYTQMLVAAPLVLLYGLSLGIAVLIDRRRDPEPEPEVPETADNTAGAAAPPAGNTYPRGLYNFTGPESGMKHWAEDEYIYEYDANDPGHADNRIAHDPSSAPSKKAVADPAVPLGTPIIESDGAAPGEASESAKDSSKSENRSDPPDGRADGTPAGNDGPDKPESKT